MQENQLYRTKGIQIFPVIGTAVAKETERIFADNIFFMNFFSKYPKKRKESLIDRHLYVSLHNSKRKHSEFSSKHSPKPLIESLKLKLASFQQIPSIEINIRFRWQRSIKFEIHYCREEKIKGRIDIY